MEVNVELTEFESRMLEASCQGTISSLEEDLPKLSPEDAMHSNRGIVALQSVLTKIFGTYAERTYSADEDGNIYEAGYSEEHPDGPQQNR